MGWLELHRAKLIGCGKCPHYKLIDSEGGRCEVGVYHDSVMFVHKHSFCELYDGEWPMKID